MYGLYTHKKRGDTQDNDEGKSGGQSNKEELKYTPDSQRSGEGKQILIASVTSSKTIS